MHILNDVLTGCPGQPFPVFVYHPLTYQTVDVRVEVLVFLGTFCGESLCIDRNAAIIPCDGIMNGKLNAAPMANKILAEFLCKRNLLFLWDFSRNSSDNAQPQFCLWTLLGTFQTGP